MTCFGVASSCIDIVVFEHMHSGIAFIPFERSSIGSLKRDSYISASSASYHKTYICPYFLISIRLQTAIVAFGQYSTSRLYVFGTDEQVLIVVGRAVGVAFVKRQVTRILDIVPPLVILAIRLDPEGERTAIKVV